MQTLKTTTDEVLCISIKMLKEYGLFSDQNIVAWQWEHRGRRLMKASASRELDTVWIRSHWPAEETLARVRITWTPCNFGGARPWFVCPERACNRRAGMLYFCPYLACRLCHELAYASECENDMLRLAGKLSKIRQRMQWEGGVFSATGSKPKGMHWHRYFAMCAKYQQIIGGLAGEVRAQRQRLLS